MAKKIILIPLALALLAVGCFEIINGNIIVVIPLADRTLEGSESFDKWFVTKEDHEDWKKYEEEINHVVDIGFSVTLTNNETSAPATGEFYISKDGNLKASDLHETSKVAFKVLSGIVVPAGGRKHITWQGSYRYMSNQDKLKSYVMSGEFWLYVKDATSPVNLSLTKTAAILTLNAKPK